MYVLDYPVSEKPKENLQNTGIGKKPEIVLQNLSFQYEKDGADVLKNVDMVFESGKVTAIAGKSGSGKSTIVNLLLGFYETEKNRIQIDGKALTSDSGSGDASFCGGSSAHTNMDEKESR